MTERLRPLKWILLMVAPVLVVGALAPLYLGPWGYFVGFVLGAAWGIVWAQFWQRRLFEKLARETHPQRNGDDRWAWKTSDE